MKTTLLNVGIVVTTMAITIILSPSAVVQANLCWYLNKPNAIRIPIASIFAYKDQLLLIDYLKQYYQIGDKHIYSDPFPKDLDTGSVDRNLSLVLIDLRMALNDTLSSRWTMFDSQQLESHSQAIVAQNESFFCFHNNQKKQQLSGKCFSLSDNSKMIVYNQDMTKSIVDRSFWEWYRQSVKCRLKYSVNKDGFRMVLVDRENQTAVDAIKEDSSYDCAIEWRVDPVNDPEPQTFEYRKQIYIFNSIFAYSFARPVELNQSATVQVRQQLLRSVLACDPNMKQQERSSKLSLLQYIMLAIGALFLLVLLFEVLYIFGCLGLCSGPKKSLIPKRSTTTTAKGKRPQSGLSSSKKSASKRAKNIEKLKNKEELLSSGDGSSGGGGNSRTNTNQSIPPESGTSIFSGTGSSDLGLVQVDQPQQQLQVNSGPEMDVQGTTDQTNYYDQAQYGNENQTGNYWQNTEGGLSPDPNLNATENIPSGKYPTESYFRQPVTNQQPPFQSQLQTPPSIGVHPMQSFQGPSEGNFYNNQNNSVGYYRSGNEQPYVPYPTAASGPHKSMFPGQGTVMSQPQSPYFASQQQQQLNPSMAPVGHKSIQPDPNSSNYYFYNNNNANGGGVGQ